MGKGKLQPPPSKGKRPRGRPTVYSKKLAEEFCNRMIKRHPKVPSRFLTLEEICSAPDMPAVQTIFGWLSDGKHRDFSELYKRAEEMKLHLLVDSTHAIAAEPCKLKVIIRNPLSSDEKSDGDEGDDGESEGSPEFVELEKTDPAAVSQKNTQIGAIHWHAARLVRAFQEKQKTEHEVGERLSDILMEVHQNLEAEKGKKK